jgi:predicted  nucleic acid-binding Zn-ribbon protein
MSSLWEDAVKVALGGLFTGGGLAAVLAYVKERRKAHADGAVAMQTIELQVDHTRMQNLEQRFALAERAWDEERESLTRRVTAAEAREGALEKALLERDTKIRELEARVARVQSELVAVTRELAGLRSDQP